MDERVKKLLKRASGSKGDKKKGNGTRNGVSDNAQKLLKLFKEGDKSFSEIADRLGVSTKGVAELAEELCENGYDVSTYEKDEEECLHLGKAEEVDEEAIPFELTGQKMKIMIISEPRMGAYQSQISMLHWLYKEVGEREGIDFAIVAGGLTVGLPTATLAPDIFKGDAKKHKVLTDYVTQHFPRTKKFKTYLISNRRELAAKMERGVNILKTVAEKRDDLAYFGDLSKTFDVRGVRIKIVSAWDDNSPKGLSYGLQKIVDNLSEDPAPHIIVAGGMHERCELSDYGENGIAIFGVPSLHTQMKRQLRRGVRPRLGCLILELDFNKLEFDKSGALLNLNKGLSAHHINLDKYAQKNDCYLTASDLDTHALKKSERKILKWFVKETAISEGELSRRLNKNKATVNKMVARLEKKTGLKIPLSTEGKRFVFPQVEKTKFKPMPYSYGDVFRFLTKEAGLACTHYGSNQELPDVIRMAYQRAADDGVRRVFHAGDTTEGPAASGYRGHQYDVKFSRMDELEDHTVKEWPRVKVKVDPKHPYLQTSMSTEKETGRPIYKEEWVKEGEVYLQTDIIDGNHDAWAETAIGHKPVRSLALRMPDLLRYLGPADGNISMDGAIVFEGVYNRLTHGGGGLGYTISSKLQKHIASHRRRAVERDKPTVLWFGNWHTNFILFRDELGILLASFKSEDGFHIRLDLVSWIGMNIVGLYSDKDGRYLTRVVSNYCNYRHLGVLNK